MKIGKLNTETTTDIILWLIRLYARGPTIGFWRDVYLPYLQDGDGSLLDQRLETWCKRWKIGPDRSACASRLMFYAFDSFWREFIRHEALSLEEVRFRAAFEAAYLHHVRWTIWSSLRGRPDTRTAAAPGLVFGRRGQHFDDNPDTEGGEMEGPVTSKAVRSAVVNLADRSGLPLPRPRLSGRPRKNAEGKGGGGEQGFVRCRELESGESPDFLRSVNVQLDLWEMVSEGCPVSSPMSAIAWYGPPILPLRESASSVEVIESNSLLDCLGDLKATRGGYIVIGLTRVVLENGLSDSVLR